MDSDTAIIAFGFLYKVCCLGVGFGSIWIGYKLFSKGIWGNAGNFEGELDNMKIVLTNGAPGTFFALFGSIIIIFTISNKVDLSKSEGESKTHFQEKISNQKLENYLDNLPEILPQTEGTGEEEVPTNED